MAETDRRCLALEHAEGVRVHVAPHRQVVTARRKVLADRQQDLSNRLHGDGMNKRIEAEELRDLLVWQVLQLTLDRATRYRHGREALMDMLAQAQAELRSGLRR